MRYLVVGAGAIGGGVAGLLHLAGLDVVVSARGEHLAALRERGLRLTVGHDDPVDVPLAVVGDPAEAGVDDETVVLLAVKSQQTAGALDGLLPHLRPTTPVVSLQNGVSNERTLLRHLAHVHAVTVMMPASHLRPGEVTVHSAGKPGLLDIGRYPTGVDDVDRAVAADLTTAGFESIPRPDAMAWKHRKLLMNLGNGVRAACAPGDDADELLRVVRSEGEAALAAAGIPVVSEDDDLARRGELLRPLVDRDGVGSSTWQSLQRRTGETEVDHLNGEIVLLGRLHDVPTPANEAVQRAVGDLARRGGEVASLAAADLLAASRRARSS
ncbi:2-dehydropantoate 2-reductase N-terminal domain-containing protein [Nocardioides marinquilinus]|uniref:2-dehydropantoate 2-reductase N-terminal domain-containing protein n=1 Tax=Nocardioides marinquilinus TaxID=1210400 RepID=A0ABP9PG56_9ACTN